MVKTWEKKVPTNKTVWMIQSSKVVKGRILRIIQSKIISRNTIVVGH